MRKDLANRMCESRYADGATCPACAAGRIDTSSYADVIDQAGSVTQIGFTLWCARCDEVFLVKYQLHRGRFRGRRHFSHWRRP